MVTMGTAPIKGLHYHYYRRQGKVAFFFYILLSQLEFLPWEIRVAFLVPKENQLQQSRATQSKLVKVQPGSFRVSMIHRTLT